MYRTTLKIDGMHCGMCEAHVNDMVRDAVDVKKVTSSHTKGETVIITETAPDLEAITAAIQKQGYRVLSSESEEYEKKGLFHRK
ncbi:MAG: cation transporter [Clostridia bacterium]|nr:cation transporter [Clostridia bacterium]